MKRISCEYNFDNCCMELKFSDGSMIAIDTIAMDEYWADDGEAPVWLQDMKIGRKIK